MAADFAGRAGPGFWIFRLFARAVFCFFGALCLQSAAVYNLKTNKEGAPDISKKRWIFLAEGCHSCDELLSELRSFCSGKKPPASRLGFFVSGQDRQKMLGKLKHYPGHPAFSGSPGELYALYGVQGSPSLLSSGLFSGGGAKKKGGGEKKPGAGKKSRIIAGKTGILKFLKKDRGFCPA